MADLELHVTPGAGADRVGPLTDGVLRVRVARPAAEGAANRAVVKLVARTLAVPQRAVVIAAGERGRRKRLTIDGLDARELHRRLHSIGEV